MRSGNADLSSSRAGTPALAAPAVTANVAGEFIGALIAVFISNGDEPGENGGLEIGNGADSGPGQDGGNGGLFGDGGNGGDGGDNSSSIVRAVGGNGGAGGDGGAGAPGGTGGSGGAATSTATMDPENPVTARTAAAAAAETAAQATRREGATELTALPRHVDVVRAADDAAAEPRVS